MMQKRLYDIVSDGKISRLTVIGDIILDSYIQGDIERISPEAPVGIFDVKSKTEKLGGSGNVAANVKALGSEVDLIALVGKDLEARSIYTLLKASKISSSFLVEDKSRRTSLKSRYISLKQQILRVDSEDRVKIDENVEKQVIDRFEESIKRSDLVIISDYKKGLLTRSLLRKIIDIANDRSIMTLVDPKGKDYTVYKGAVVITPNRKEASLASGIDISDDEDLKEAASKIMKVTKVKSLLVTEGADGISYFGKGSDMKRFPAEALEVYDVSGAGDTVIATLGVVFSKGYSMEDGIKLANIAGGIEVSHLGAYPVKREDLLYRLGSSDETDSKICNIAQLLPFLKKLRDEDKKIVFTNGCFDILHAGHVELLEKAKKFGDYLIVGLNSDLSVRRLKGSNRPLINQDDRARLLSSLAMIDAVIIFDEDTPLNLIKKIRPDFLVKGGDYSRSQIVGADYVKKHKGEVKIISLLKNRSTSSIVSKIKSQS